MGVGFALMTAMFYGFANVYSRKASKNVSGLDAIALTVGLNALFFVPAALLIKWIQGTPWPDWITLSLYFCSGIFSIFLGRWGLYNAILFMGPSRASMIKNSAPVFTILLAAIFFGRWPSFLPLMGIVIILLAIWLLGFQNKEGIAAQSVNETWNKGMVLGILVAVTFAVSDVIRALSMQRVPDLVVATGVSILGGWAAMFILLMAKGRALSTYKKHWNSLNYDLVMTSLFAGLAQISAFVAVLYLFVPYASALIATAPLFTALFSMLLAEGDERFGIRFWASMSLFMAGGTFIILFK